MATAVDAADATLLVAADKTMTVVVVVVVVVDTGDAVAEATRSEARKA